MTSLCTAAIRRGSEIILLVSVLATTTPGHGQARTPPPTRESFYTAALSCWNDEWRDYRSRSLQSPVFTSPDGKSRAYVRILAEAKGKNKKGSEVCLHRSILYVATSSEFKPVYTAVGVPQGPHGNALQLVDWSPDSGQLLIQLTTWWYESECCDFTLLLHSPALGTIRRINMDLVLAKDGCTFVGWIEGFAENGEVVFRADSSEPIGNPCVENTTWWQLNPTTLRAKRIRQPPKLRRYALTDKPIPSEPWKDRIPE